MPLEKIKYRLIAFLKEAMRDNKRLYRRSRLIMRKNRVKQYPDWATIVGSDLPAWNQALEKSRGGKPLLIASADGGHLAGVVLETLLAGGLTLRGAEVHVLLCDGALPACWECDSTLYPNLKRFADKGPQADLCRTCYAPAEKAFRAMGVIVHRFSDFLTAEDRAEALRLSRSLSAGDLGSFRHEGLAVGEHALAGALRFYARGDIQGEPYAKEVQDRYFQAAYLSAVALLRLLRKHRFQSVTTTHGIYVPFGLIDEAARKEKTRVINWNVAYRKRCFVFSHDDTYHHTLMNEPVGNWENMPWSPELDARIMTYLKQRMQGSSQDWIWFHDRPQFDMDAISKEIGLDPSKPCIGMLSNVIWDAQLHYPANAFPNMIDWAVKTIEYFRSRPDLQLLIRVHPAEIRGFLKSRQLMADEIRKAFPELPKNVFVIGPESQYSTYALMGFCDSVIIYGTKTGVELTSMGIPVIVAGEAWIRNKGVTRDATTAADYFRILDTLPVKERLDEATVRRARMYAFHFFFRRMIPFGMLKVQDSSSLPFTVEISGLKDIAEGADAGFDVVCDGILKGTDFIYRDEARITAPKAPAAQAG
jgi:hypothetical protein